MMPFSTPDMTRARSHSMSLSIARSPSVLASASFGAVSPNELEPVSPFDLHSHPNHHPSHPPWKGSALGRSVSAGGGGHLSTIASVEDLTDSVQRTTAQALLDPNQPSQESYTSDTFDRYNSSLSAPLLHTRTDPGSPWVAGEDGESADIDAIERLQGPALEYTGAFQPPDSKELMLIALSFGGVLVLSVAAGLATIYDWVL